MKVTKSFQRDVLRGLAEKPKHIPCKYFYDKRGSMLFDRICEQNEYYLTRAETALLHAQVEPLADVLGHDATLFELGSGSSTKTCILLDTRRVRRYTPIDISAKHLEDTAETLRVKYPTISITPVVADYSRSFNGLLEPTNERRVVIFPGSSIGNFEPPDAVEILSRMATLAGRSGVVIVGVDLPKDSSVLHAAYDDRAGVTADFNKNLLLRCNEELDANFDVSEFEHHAPWQEDHSRIEMRLVSKKGQTVRVLGERFSFDRGEYIVTEHCYKWTADAFTSMARRAGLVSDRVLYDPDRLVSLHVLRPS